MELKNKIFQYGKYRFRTIACMPHLEVGRGRYQPSVSCILGPLSQNLFIEPGVKINGAYYRARSAPSAGDSFVPLYIDRWKLNLDVKFISEYITPLIVSEWREQWRHLSKWSGRKHLIRRDTFTHHRIAPNNARFHVGEKLHKLIVCHAVKTGSHRDLPLTLSRQIPPCPSLIASPSTNRALTSTSDYYNGYNSQHCQSVRHDTHEK